MLALAFPDFAGQIHGWRLINARLDELCQDFLILKRNYLHQVRRGEAADRAFITDLSDATRDLGQDIENLLTRMSAAASAIPVKKQCGKDTQ